MKKSDPVVCIRCMTYNQEKFIAQCLDGFVMQKTDFSFIAIVHDDASTDKTPLIIQEYAARYPEIIVPVLEKENQYSQGKLSKVMYPLMKGKYIAVCEGDDYWTDPLKLQKQVCFMESHPDYAMCFHQAIRHHEDSNIPDCLYSDIENREYSGQELYQSKHRPPTASILIRHSVFESDVYKQCLDQISSFGDLSFFLSAAHCGKVYGMTDVMSVYRMNNNGVTNVFNSTNDIVLKFANENLKLYKIFGEQYKEECVNVYVIDYINHFFRCRQYGVIRLRLLTTPLMKFPKHTLQLFFQRVVSHYKKNK